MGIPDEELYRPTYTPWLHSDFGKIAKQAYGKTLVSDDRLYVLWTLAKNCSLLDGEFWECGVYKGGTAKVIINAPKIRPVMRLFDTFKGIPNAEKDVDLHSNGDFNDTSLESVEDFVGEGPIYHMGEIPETFKGLEECRISFAHVDVDTYRSVLDCCQFIWPRMVTGGVMVFDDYGFPSCPGARKAVDEYFDSLSPLILRTGQALVIKI